jgi:hypothetical protein
MSRQFQGSLGPFTEVGNERTSPREKTGLEPLVSKVHAIAEWIATEGLAWLVVSAGWGAFCWWVMK